MHDLLGRGAIDELVNHIVPLTVHGWEEINQDTQYDSTEQELIALLLDFSEDTLQPVHGAGEVEADQSACNSQKDATWDNVDAESLVEAENE